MTTRNPEHIEGIAPYLEVAEKILQLAMKRRSGKTEKGYLYETTEPNVDEKGSSFETIKKGLVTLIGAGADVKDLNQWTGDINWETKECIGIGCFYHEVQYKDHKFILHTDYPIVPKINNQRRAQKCQ